jgi:hypothetical protein
MNRIDPGWLMIGWSACRKENRMRTHTHQIWKCVDHGGFSFSGSFLRGMIVLERRPCLMLVRVGYGCWDPSVLD